ncbi:MAG: hypothetical protein QMO91_07280 [Candidatus Tisiphia sp.]|nr:hypothetical protein [Candidatus Tisiphia sp.]
MVIKYNDKFKKTDSDKLHRFDSTIITLSGKLLTHLTHKLLICINFVVLA